MGSEETFSFKAQNRAIKLIAIFCENSSNLNLACIIEMKVKKYFLIIHLNVIKASKIKGIRLDMIFDKYNF